jgi:hypothetical protein
MTATTYRVTAPYVVLKLKDHRSGKTVVTGFYADARVTDVDVDPESLKRHLDRGWIEEVEETEKVEQVEPPADIDLDDDPDTDPDAWAGTGGTQRPAQGDSKAAWVEYAVANGAERIDAEAMTKAELIEMLK